MKKDKIRKHLHELSSGDLHILYSMLVGFKQDTDSQAAHDTHVCHAC